MVQQKPQQPQVQPKPKVNRPKPRQQPWKPSPFPLYGGNLSRAIDCNWDTSDPHRSNADLPFQVFNDTMGRLLQIYDHADGNSEWREGLMSFPEIPDPVTYILWAEQGARWSDRFPTEGGRLFTMEDVAYNMQRQSESVDANGQFDPRFWRSANYQRHTSIEFDRHGSLVLRTDLPDATYLESVHMSFSFITSPEAIDLWDQKWLDDPLNVDYFSGCGPFIPTQFAPYEQVYLEYRPDPRWEILQGQELPLLDSITWKAISGPLAIETAYRNGEIDIVDSLPFDVVNDIEADFPDHVRFSRPIAEPLCTRFNYNTEWADNPWLDRRVPYAFHLATDRAAIIDHVYQGQARPSAIQRINWYHPWSIPEDQLHSLPGFHSNKDEDIAYARELLAAAGVEPGSEFRMLFSDSFVDQHPGLLELYASMYNTALDLDLRVDLRSNAVINQMRSEGTFPGHLPMPVPSSTGDPIESWLEELVFDASENLEGYNFPPVEELIKGIAEQWDLDKRRETTREVTDILLGEDDRYGFDGFGPVSAVCNGVQSGIHWPYLNFPSPATKAWGDEGGHWRKEL